MATEDPKSEGNINPPANPLPADASSILVSSTAHRGRGRPPKSKPALPSGIVLPPPRPRGRPPKPRDPFATMSPTKKTTYSGPAESGRKRGRPLKFPKVLLTQGDTDGGTALPSDIVLPPLRPRGRPPKPKDPFAMPTKKMTDSGLSGSGRKRGRPPKFPKVLPTQGHTNGGAATSDSLEVEEDHLR